MKKIIGLLIVLALILPLKKGWALIQKMRYAKRLKFGIDSVDFPKLDLFNLKLSDVLSDIETNIGLLIKNFSPTTFSIEQISIEVLSPSGKKVAEQKKPLTEAFEIEPNKNNVLPLSFLISSQNLKTLISESGGIVNVGARFITTGDYGIPLHLQGFVVAEGVEIDINEKLTV